MNRQHTAVSSHVEDNELSGWACDSRFEDGDSRLEDGDSRLEDSEWPHWGGDSRFEDSERARNWHETTRRGASVQRRLDLHAPQF